MPPLLRRILISSLPLVLIVIPLRAAALQQLTDRAPRPFRHETHGALECTDCHATRQAHGRLMITSAADCQRCHHARRFAEPCARCHEPATLSSALITVTQSMRMGGDATAVRPLPFSHGTHADFACGQCHAPAAPFAAIAATCADCHADHHAPDADCTVCHRTPREAVHDRDAHLTCTGAGCHAAARAPDPAPRTRQSCLACHQDLSEHLPGRLCVDCHVLPRTGSAVHGGAR